MPDQDPQLQEISRKAYKSGENNCIVLRLLLYVWGDFKPSKIACYIDNKCDMEFKAILPMLGYSEHLGESGPKLVSFMVWNLKIMVN